MGYYERPEYRVTRKDGNFELRQFEEFHVVKYYDDKDKELEDGFQTLFRYISKSNLSKTKISMTVPVLEEKHDSRGTMAFVVPREFGGEVPEPLDSRLAVEKVESGYYAVISYGGNSHETMESKMKSLLQEWIQKNNWKIVGDFLVAYYNPPFIPGIFRHNEIWVRVLLD